MRLYLDLDSRNFLESPRFPRALTTLAFKRRDTDLIELQFLRDNTVQELPTGTTIRLGLKSSADYSASFLATTSAFTKSGTGTSTKYLAELNLNTTDLNTAFSSATPAEPETLSAMAEVEWTSGSTISSSKTLPVTIANDVIRGDEGEPASLPLFYTSETSDFKATQAQAQAGTNNAAWMSPLRVFQAIAAWVSANPISATWASLTGKPSTFPPDAHTHTLSNLTQSGATTGQVPSWNGSAWAPATPTSGGGSASWNTLSDKPATFPPSTHTHAAADITTGTFALARIPTGTTPGTVALGNHTHSNLAAPLVIDGGDTTTINGWGIQNDFGPTILSFEEAFLQHGNSEVLHWGNNGELSVGSRRLTNLGAPVDANDAVRKNDLDTKANASHDHPLSALTQSGATSGQVPAWNGSAWAPQSISPASTSWNTLTDKPNTFPPSSHLHSGADITSGKVGLEYLPVGNTGAHVASGYHSHGNINADGSIDGANAQSGRPLITGHNGTLTAGFFGTGASNVARGDHVHGNLSNSGAIGTLSGLPIITGNSGVLTTGSFGTTSGTFSEGNHTHPISSITNLQTSLNNKVENTTGSISTNLTVGNTNQNIVLTKDSISYSSNQFGTGAGPNEPLENVTQISFVNRNLKQDNFEILNWSSNSSPVGTKDEKLSVCNRRLINIAEPIESNDAVRFIDSPIPQRIVQNINSNTSFSPYTFPGGRNTRIYYNFESNSYSPQIVLPRPEGLLKKARFGDIVRIRFKPSATATLNVARYFFNGTNYESNFTNFSSLVSTNGSAVVRGFAFDGENWILETEFF